MDVEHSDDDKPKKRSKITAAEPQPPAPAIEDSVTPEERLRRAQELASTRVIAIIEFLMCYNMVLNFCSLVIDSRGF